MGSFPIIVRMSRRQAFLAGTWYPDDPSACRDFLHGHAPEHPSRQGDERVAMVPHAGWRFSGAIAAKTLSALREVRADADLVVLFGNHLHTSQPHRIFCGDCWCTPLGDFDTFSGAAALREALAEEFSVVPEPVVPETPDNGSEVPLPMLRHFFPKAELLMVAAAPRGDAQELGDRIGQWVKDRDAVFVASTDLTHYGPAFGLLHESGQAWAHGTNDERFLRSALGRDSVQFLEHALSERSACCPGTLAAALAAQDAVAPDDVASPSTGRIVARGASTDVAPGPESVGYAGVVW